HHSLRARPLPPLLNGPFDKFPFTQTLDRHALGRGRRKAQRHLFVENERESRPDMLAQRLAHCAVPPQPAVRRVHKADRDDRRGFSFARCQWELKAKQIFTQAHVFLDAKIPAIPSPQDRKSTRLNSSHRTISYAVFCLKKKKKEQNTTTQKRRLITQNIVRAPCKRRDCSRVQRLS